MNKIKIAMMQPYWFPYKGYFSLYLNCDVFIFLDDVNFINKGYINRNKILTKNGPVNLTIPLSKSSQNKRINQIYTHNLEYFSKKIEKTIFNSFCKRPFGKEALKLFNQSTGKNDRPIFEIAVSSIINTARYLSISKDFFFSSKLNLENFSGEKRIIEICKIFKATEYVNLLGGINFYNPENFKKNFIKLSFLKNHSYSYEQGSQLFYPDLSILDLIANLNIKNVINQINQFSIIRKTI